MKPTIGRIVHFTDALGARDLIRAAIVTEVEGDDSVSLRVFYPPRVFRKPVGGLGVEPGHHADMVNVRASDAPAGAPAARGRWAWPTRDA